MALACTPPPKRSWKSPFLPPSFITPPRGVSRANGLDDMRINPHFVQRIVPQSTAEQDRSSVLRICTAISDAGRRWSRVLRKEMNRGIHGIHGRPEKRGLRSTNRPSQNNISLLAL
jgi:hypothetical protein